MTPETLRIAAAVLSAVGSILLAWRVTGILRALGAVAKAHEQNITNLMEARDGGALLIHGNTPKQVERAQRFRILVAGFVCLIASAALQVIAQLM